MKMAELATRLAVAAQVAREALQQARDENGYENPEVEEAMRTLSEAASDLAEYAEVVDAE